MGVYVRHDQIRFDHHLYDRLGACACVQGFDDAIKGIKGSLTSSDFFYECHLRNIVLGLAATLGFYVFTSLLFVSYSLLLPFFFL